MCIWSSRCPLRERRLNGRDIAPKGLGPKARAARDLFRPLGARPGRHWPRKCRRNKVGHCDASRRLPQRLAKQYLILLGTPLPRSPSLRKSPQTPRLLGTPLPRPPSLRKSPPDLQIVGLVAAQPRSTSSQFQMARDVVQIRRGWFALQEFGLVAYVWHSPELQTTAVVT